MTLLRTAILVGVAALFAWLCMFQVNPNESVFVARFGDPRRLIEEPGLYFKWPPPMDRLIRVDQRVRVLDPGADEYLTADKKNIDVDTFMAWSVVEPRKFIRTVNSVSGAEGRLTDVMRSVVGDVLSSVPFTALVSTEAQEQTLRDIVEAITVRARDKARENFGIQVAAIRVKRLNFPTQNKQAVFSRMEAERDAIAQGYRSEGKEQLEKIKAEADREQAQLLSEARRKAEEMRGQADADALRILGEAIALDPELYAFQVQLDMWQEALGKGSVLVLPNDHELLDVLRPSSIPGND